MLSSQIKREFSLEEIEKLVVTLGSDPPLPMAEGLIFQTICHNPPHTGKYKLYYYTESQRFHCYTECGDTFDIYDLIKRSRKCSFGEAWGFVKNVLGIVQERTVGFVPIPPISSLTDDWDLLIKYSDFKKKAQGRDEQIPLKPYPKQMINFFEPIPPIEWVREGISIDSMNKFGIRFDVENNAAVIPHYNKEGELLGIRSRSFDPSAVASGNKYMPTYLQGEGFTHPLQYNLYGLNQSMEAIKRTGKIMLFEAEKSCLLCDTYYGENNFSVAVCGSNISNAQKDLILSLGVNEVFLGFDKEYNEAFTKESDAYAEKLLKFAGMFTPYCTVYVLYDTLQLLQRQDAPVDRGQNVLEQLLRTKFEVTTQL